MSDCPEGTILSQSAAVRAMRQRDAAEDRLAYRAGADLGALLEAARRVMPPQVEDDASAAMKKALEAMERATEGLAYAESAMRDMEAMGSACTRERWNSGYRELCRCRDEVRKAEDEVEHVRRFLEPLARRGGGSISRIEAWPVEAP